MWEQLPSRAPKSGFARPNQAKEEIHLAVAPSSRNCHYYSTTPQQLAAPALHCACHVLYMMLGLNRSDPAGMALRQQSHTRLRVFVQSLPGRISQHLANQLSTRSEGSCDLEPPASVLDLCCVPEAHKATRFIDEHKASHTANVPAGPQKQTRYFWYIVSHFHRSVLFKGVLYIRTAN